MYMQNILVVEDEAGIARLLKAYLEYADFQVEIAQNGEEGLKKFFNANPSLVLLDLMLPVINGWQVLQVIRERSSCPVIIITAREEETDAVLGLELGADDYVVKPFRMRELLARIRAALRRTSTGGTPAELLRVQDVQLDQGAHTVTVKNEPVTLTPIEFDLLAVLMRSPGQVFTRTQLVEHLLESGFTGLDRTLNVHIRNLRMKIELDPASPAYIETVFGIGYRFHKPASP
jgi:DNA-binding response OmpR family regulator